MKPLATSTGGTVKRLRLLSASTLLLMLLSMPLGSAHAALAPLDVGELEAVTAGLCNNCPPDEAPDGTPKPPKIVSYSWEIVSAKTGQPTQMSYSLERDFTNRSSVPVTYTYLVDEQCRMTLTSGGVGVSTALSLTVGVSRVCSKPTTAQLTIPPNKRIKLYKGHMRVITTYVAQRFAHYSDGTTEPVGAADNGVLHETYMKYTTIDGAL